MTEKQCHLGDVCGEPLPPMRAVVYRRHHPARDWIRSGTAAITGAVAVVVYTALLVALLLVSFLFAAAPVLAQVPVPQECVELAKREGYPTDVMSKTQVARARVRMKHLGDDDPIVRSCRNAIAQLRAMQREMKK